MLLQLIEIIQNSKEQNTLVGLDTALNSPTAFPLLADFFIYPRFSGISMQSHAHNQTAGHN